MAQLKYEVVVFIAVICAVHAAVTVNIYGDDVDTVKEKEVRRVEDCNLTNCDRMCQMLGFKFGVCRGDTCQCSSFVKDEDQFESNDIPSLDKDTVGTRLSGCNPSACDHLCRRLQFPGGVCVNGRCKCDNFRQGSDQLESNEIPSLNEDTAGTRLSDCNPSACDHLCRRLQFPGGVCVNGRCKCDNFRRGSDNQIAAVAVDACNANACNQICHRLGFRYGVCIGDICRRSNMRIALALDEDKKENMVNSLQNNIETVPTNAALACDQLACVMGCTELGFPGGTCFLGKCRCNRRDNEEKRSNLRGIQDCNNVNCYFTCVRMGYLSGRCLDGRCLCA